MLLRRVVIGTDYGEPSLETAAWVAGTLARDADIVLVHAIDDDTPSGTLVDASVRDVANERMREVTARLAIPRLRTEIVVGRPHHVIADVAEREHADLIVVGAHGSREHESRLLGTTADRVVRGATRPVLVGARSAVVHDARVVVAVDDAEPTHTVLEWCEFAAQRLSARVTLLHVLSSGAYGYLLSVAAAHAHGDELLKRSEVNEELDYHVFRWRQEAAEAGIDPARLDVYVRHGSAAEEILDVTRRHDASLLIVGRHDGAPGAPALLGRTVRHVLHAATCHLVIVPRREDR